MTEKKPCRWGPIIRQASVLGRFKNKLRLKKLEWKRFYEDIWGPTHPTADSDTDGYLDVWETSHHDSSEGSIGSTHDHSQYFDSLTPEEVNEQYQQQTHIPTHHHHHYQSAVPVIPSRFHQEVQGTAVGQWPPTSLHNAPVVQAQAMPVTTTTPWMHPIDSFDSGTLSVSEYLDTDDSCADTFTDWWQLERNVSTGMSVDSTPTGHMDLTRDTGDSSAIPMGPEDRLLWFKKFFEVGAEEALTGPRPQGSRSWRAMVRLVCACKKLSMLLWMRKMEKEASGQAMVKKRCRGFGENRSQLYKGVRRRNGKWVSEIRVGQTKEKVWLGSFDTETEAALAFDAGFYHCSAKRNRSFNFPDSPLLLGPPINLRDLSPKDRKKTIQRLAEDHAKAGASSTAL